MGKMRRWLEILQSGCRDRGDRAETAHLEEGRHHGDGRVESQVGHVALTHEMFEAEDDGP